MLSMIVHVAVLAAPTAHWVPPGSFGVHLAVAPVAPTLTQMTEHVVETSNPWTGDRGRNRIVGISLTATAGALSFIALGLFAAAASLPTGYGTPYCPYAPAYCTGYPYYPYGYVPPPSPVPYILAGLLSLGVAATSAAFGIPMMVRGFGAGAGASAALTPGSASPSASAWDT